MDLTPEHTTATGVRASVARSAETSQLSRASLCTPPRPPVAKSFIPARRQVRGGGDGRRPVAALHSRYGEVPRRELGDFAGSRHQAQLVLVQPYSGHPADDSHGRGTAPSARTVRSASRATSRLSGLGAVGDQRGLERYYRSPSTESLRYLALDLYAAGSIQRGSLLEGLLTKRLTG